MMHLHYIRKANPRFHPKDPINSRVPIVVYAMNAERVLYRFFRNGRTNHGCVSREMFNREYVKA